MANVRKTLWQGVLVLGLACLPAAQADVVELFDGSRIETQHVEFKDGLVVLDDGRSIPRRDVRKIVIETAAASELDRAPLPAGADVHELLRKAEAAREQYPDVGAIHLIDDGDWTLRPDGTQIERTHNATLIMKEPWKSMGRITQWYEDGRDHATLVRARTIAPDGTVHEFDPADLKETKPTGGMVSFNKYKTLTGQLPEVEIGSIVETIWERETYNPYDEKLFFPYWNFGGSEPVLTSRATIRVPKDVELHYRLENFPDPAAAPQTSADGEYRVYQWELEDVEHIITEPGMPPIGEVVPTLKASLFTDWDYIFDFLGKFQKEHTQVTPAIRAQVAEIVGDSTDDDEKVAKLYHWLQREIRYISIKGSMGSGWSGHPAELTLENKYGDCIDKATLFATMLKAIDIKAEPVVLATYGMPEDDRTLPTMWGNHAITEVHLNGRDFHLDCTGTSFRYPYFVLVDHGRTTINVLDRRIGCVETPPAEENALDVDLNMRLMEDGTVQAVMTLNMNGSMEGIARAGLEQINKMLRKMVAEQAINSLSPGAKLIKLEVTDEADLAVPLEIKLKILLPDYPTRAGDLMIFELPLAKLVKMVAAITALEQREFDIQSPSTLCLRQHVRLHLPPGYEPKGLPEGIELATPYTSYAASYSFEDGTIVFSDNLSMTKPLVPAEDYERFKRFMEDFTDFSKLPLFLYKARS